MGHFLSDYYLPYPKVSELTDIFDPLTPKNVRALNLAFVTQSALDIHKNTLKARGLCRDEYLSSYRGGRKDTTPETLKGRGKMPWQLTEPQASRQRLSGCFPASSAPYCLYFSCSKRERSSKMKNLQETQTNELSSSQSISACTLAHTHAQHHCSVPPQV